MSAVTRPRGPLPARVYWTRRTLVVLLALGLVFALAQLLGGSGSSGGEPSAQPVGADASTTSSAPTTSAAPTTPTTVTTVTTAPTVAAGSEAPTTATGQSTATPLAGSSGPCRTDDIVATPTIKGPAYAGKSVVFALDLTTKTAAACDFEVSAATLVLKVTSGVDRIWSTQDCPGTVPKQSLVVRKDTPTAVDVTWNAHRSDSTCSRSTNWAEYGYYHAVAAAFGSDPVDEQFQLLPPVRATVTATPTPDPKATATSSPSAAATPKHAKHPKHPKH